VLQEAEKVATHLPCLSPLQLESCQELLLRRAHGAPQLFHGGAEMDVAPMKGLKSLHQERKASTRSDESSCWALKKYSLRNPVIGPMAYGVAPIDGPVGARSWTFFLHLDPWLGMFPGLGCSPE
jgi:hypothetical protein